MSPPVRSTRPLAVIAASSFPPFALLYAALYSAYGTESPFFPSFLAARDLSAGEIGVVLSVGAGVRICSGMVLGTVADRFGTRRILAIAAVFAGLIALLYLRSVGLWPLLVVCVLHSVATAPLAPFADALSLNASVREGIYPYGWVRGIGSACFLLGTLASGQLVARFGLASIIVASSVGFLLMVVPIPRLPPTARSRRGVPMGGLVALMSMPRVRGHRPDQSVEPLIDLGSNVPDRS